MGAHNLTFSIHLSDTKLSMSLSHADTFTRQTWTPTYTCTIALQHIWIIKIKIQANTLIFYVGENIIIYTIIHVTSVPIWPKFELVQDFMPVLLPASLTKIRLKMKASAWRHRFTIISQWELSVAMATTVLVEYAAFSPSHWWYI